MQGERGELAHVFHGPIPSQSIVQVGYDAKVNLIGTSPSQHLSRDSRLIGVDQIDFVNEFGARHIKNAAEFLFADPFPRVGKGDDSLHLDSKAAQGFKVLLHRSRFRKRTDHQDVTVGQPGQMAPLQYEAMDKAAQAQEARNKSKQDQQKAARNLQNVG